MKKLLSVLILSILLIGLAAPAVTSAQAETLKECCTLNQNIDFGDNVKCDKGDVAAPDGTAAEDCGKGDGTDWCSKSADSWGMFCLVNTIYTATNWIFYILMVVVVIMIVIGGATYMLAAGDPEKAGKGKKIIVYGIIGLVIALIARLIPSVVRLIVGM